MPTIHGQQFEKGTTLPTAAVLTAVKKSQLLRDPGRNQASIRFVLMSFARRLERHLRAEGYAANLRTHEGGVTWLTDAEALKFNRRRNRHGGRKLRRALAGLQHVTESELNDTEKREFERTIAKAEREVLALANARRPVLEFAVPQSRER
jgi:hypothetical protein